MFYCAFFLQPQEDVLLAEPVLEPLLEVVLVPALPRNAQIEWQVYGSTKIFPLESKSFLRIPLIFA